MAEFNLLLTGGTGFVGSHAAVVLGQAHRVVILDNLSNSRSDVAEKIARIAGREIPLVCGDIRDTELVGRLLREHAIDAVLHFAGLKAVGESIERPLDYYANNVQGTISLLQAMQANSVKALVFSSSATVYGVPKYLPLDEDHPTSATNPYGRCKLHVEEMLADLVSSDPEWAVASLRYFNPVGAHESRVIGESPNGVPNNLMPYIAQVASGQRPELTVFGNDYPTPDGTGIRDYIHVMDLAEGHVAALAYVMSNRGYTAINLGTGEGTSVLQLVRAFERISDRMIPFKVGPRRAGDVAESYASPAKAHRLLGWHAKRGLQDICSSAWQYQEGNR